MHAVRVLEHKAENLLPDLQRIEQPLNELIGALGKSDESAQKRLAGEIHALSHSLVQGVRDDLGALADAAQRGKQRMAQLAEAEGGGGSGQQLADLAAQLNGLIDRLIDGLERVELPAVAKLQETKLAEEVVPSFRKLWGWVLEVFFGASASRYYWPEFAAKALRKHEGRELKRRMIVHNYAHLSNSERMELLEINSLHAQFLTAKLAHPQLNAFLECLKLIGEYVALHGQYAALKKTGSDSEETRLVREEERKFTEQSLALCAPVYAQSARIEAVLDELERVFA